MIHQSKFSPLSKLPIIPFSNKPFVNTTGVELPGITEETQKFALELLKDNHDNYDIWSNERGYHNHSAHYILAAYSCGASVEVLKEISKHFYRRPRLLSKVKITQENWLLHLSDETLYTDYLAFFEEEIAKEGMQAIFEKYAFHSEMFPRLFDGALHPIIHVGYAIEFQLPMMMAEGLAQTAIHPDSLRNILNEDYFSFKGPEKRTVMDIIEAVQKDKQYEAIHFNDKEKSMIAASQLADPIREITKTWVIPETEEDVLVAAKEHYESLALLFGATAIRPDKEILALDFFLMHALTSALLIHAMLPYVDMEKRIKLLRAHFACSLTEYVARGRPHLHIDALKEFKPKKLSSEPNPWLDVVKLFTIRGERIACYQVC